MLNRYTAVACSLDGWEAVVPWLLKFSCHTVHNRRINDGSVKALLPGRVIFSLSHESEVGFLHVRPWLWPAARKTNQSMKRKQLA
jgi:hypothetical protein